MHSPQLMLVDAAGRAIDPRITAVLKKMLPRFRRWFPSLRDDVALIEVLERAAQGIARREQRLGPLEHLDGYAWVTLRTVAVSRLRLGPARIADRTMKSEGNDELIASATAPTHTAGFVEGRVLLKQVLAQMTPHERRILVLKEAGFSTAEIARQLHRSAVSVDTACSRARAKARRLVNRQIIAAPTRG